MTENSLTEEVFKLKGRLFTLTVLELSACRLSEFQQHLEQLYHKAPNMFVNTPVVLDLKPLKGTSFDLKGVIEHMRQFNMVPVAVQHASVIQQKAAAAAGLAVLLSRDGDEAKPLEKALAAANSGEVVSNSIKHRQAKPPKKNIVASSEEPQVALASNSAQSDIAKVITQPVRSGQQVYAKGGDLIVLASVGTGAELLADGHIHVYGTLRGRALAGIKGDKSARIFCSDLKAELVSIAGQYLMLEADAKSKGAKQILIKDNSLKIIDL